MYVCLYSCLSYTAWKSHLFCAALYCHLWRVWLYVCPHYLINGTILRKKLLSIKCVFRFSLQLLCETFLILRRIQRDIIINVHRSSCQLPLILVRFYGDLNFLNRLSKNAHISDFMKIRPAGAKFYADRRMDRHDEANDGFPQLCHRAKKSRENPTAVVRWGSQLLLGIPSEDTALENYMRDAYTPARRDHLPEKQKQSGSHNHIFSCPTNV